MSESRDQVCTVRERYRSTPNQVKMEQELASAEKEVQRHLRSILNAARETRAQLKEMEERYHARIGRLEYFKCAVAPQLDPAVDREIQQGLKRFSEEVQAYFDPAQRIPADVLTDLSAGNKLYHNGRL